MQARGIPEKNLQKIDSINFTFQTNFTTDHVLILLEKISPVDEATFIPEA